MATRSLPAKGQKNWGDMLNNYLSIATDENGSVYTFEDDAEMIAYFDGSTPHKTLDHGKTAFIKGTGKIMKYDEEVSSSWKIAWRSGSMTGDTAPSSGVELGDTFYNTTEEKMYFWNGSEWIDFPGG